MKKTEKQAMGRDVAEKFLEDWFDYRKTSERARRNSEDGEQDILREKLIDGFSDGILIFEPSTGILTQKLQEPVEKEGGEVILTELHYKPRVKRNALIEPMKGVKATDTEGRMRAWISAVTGVNKTLLGQLDLSDYAYSEILINYFLV